MKAHLSDLVLAEWRNESRSLLTDFDDAADLSPVQAIFLGMEKSLDCEGDIQKLHRTLSGRFVIFGAFCKGTVSVLRDLKDRTGEDLRDAS